MPRKPKKPPWNHNLRIPGYGSAPAHPPPKPMPGVIHPSHSTPGAPAVTDTTGEWECGRCAWLAEPVGDEPREHHRFCEWRGGDPPAGG